MADPDPLAIDLEHCMPLDRPALARRLRGLRRRARAGKPVDRGLAALERDAARSRERLAARAAALPRPRYPEELPVVARRADIRAAVAANQVVIVCGETGSGKTTQLPKICLELGRGAAGMIGHTQPRRIAARSLAARLAEELEADVGGAVGCKVRFHERVGPGSFVKVMTDGILLAETQGDPDLLAYDTLIIDEAHERGLNIDFLLGYLKRLLARRPELKLIITSATIDPERFAAHFGGAPIIEVSGRTYPVEVRYRPVQGEDEETADRDRGQAIVDACAELARLGPGDILVFLPGERDIREAAERLRKHHPPHTELLPLYARLSAAQQARVFKPHAGRRIVLATNVAETSLTVPGIRYVVDTGLARVSRYSYRTKVQRLPVEPVSRASADQRAGRCGRVAAGVCVRLYSEEDYLARPRFTEPELLRTNLAAVILQMLALGLGDVDDFPFVDPPDPRYVRDGYRLLAELGAVDADNRITELGRSLARLPVDPRLGRMLLAARELGCLAEALVIVSALAVQDPRERPLDRQQAADEKHKAFADARSDFLAYLQLWRFYHEQARHLSQNKLRKLCKAHFLSYVRLREWHDVHQQLQGLVKDMGMGLNTEPAGYEAVHKALATGLLGNLAQRTEARAYTGARGVMLQIFPGSALAKKPPRWIIAGELVETGRRYARTVAAVDPRWIEPLAGHLVRREHSEPHWDPRAGRVRAYERVTLYGLPLVTGRKVDFGPLDPEAARELFIRGALVEGRLHSKAPFLAHNQALIAEVEALEAKSRRRDLLVDEAAIHAFFEARVPAGIHDARRFERWRRQAEREQPRLLYLSREDVLAADTGGITEALFPETLAVAGMALPVSYHFAPGHPADGATVRVPLAALNALDPAPFEWLVPGLRREKITALIRSLPKTLRRHFVPAPDVAGECVTALGPDDGPLLPALTGFLGRRAGVDLPADAWRPELLAPHLFMNFRVVDAGGDVLAEGRDLAALQAELGTAAAASFRGEAGAGLERDRVERWDFGALPERVELRRAGVTLRGYPALVAEDDGVALRVLDAPEAAAAAHRAGLLALFRRRCAAAVKRVARGLPDIQTLCLHFAAVGSCQGLKDDIVATVLREAFLPDGADVRDPADFEARAADGERRLAALANDITGWAGAALAAHHGVARRLKGGVPPQWLAALEEVRGQLADLIHPGFVQATPVARLPHLARYIQAVGARLDKLERDPGRDRRLAAQVARQRARLDKLRARLGDDHPDVAAWRWLIEEYRVSLFAQELGTAEKVSEKRLDEIWGALNR